MRQGFAHYSLTFNSNVWFLILYMLTDTIGEKMNAKANWCLYIISKTNNNTKSVSDQEAQPVPLT